MRIKEFHTDSSPAFAIALKTPYDEDEDEVNLFHLQIYKYDLWLEIPQLIKPKKIWVKYKDYGYWDIIRRDYGITFNSEAIHIHYGVQPMNWSKDDPENSDHSKVIWYPWDWTHVRHDILEASQTWSMPYEQWNDLKEKMYKTRGSFYDYPETPEQFYKFFTYYDPHNNCEVEAKAIIEEREWHRGKWGWFRNILKLFPFGRIVRRYLNVEFKEETGPRKGSWKGGTIGCSIDMLKGESIDDAIERFKLEWPAKA